MNTQQKSLGPCEIQVKTGITASSRYALAGIQENGDEYIYAMFAGTQEGGKVKFSLLAISFLVTEL